MINLLDNQDKSVAQGIRQIFQLSYAVEARLLRAVNFPPLRRPLSAFINCENTFYGFTVEDELAGVIEIHVDEDIHIQSLVVLPSHFRKGIASQLIDHILKYFDHDRFFVETGMKNIPAISLYEHFGFVKIKEWDTDHGVRKIRMEKNMVS